MRARFLAAALSALLPCIPGPSLAQSSEPLQRAAQRSQQDLESSRRELAALRESIASEKLPLSRRLRDMEQRLATLRTRKDEALRSIDSEGLQSGRLQMDTERRRAEIAYVESLLDEHARNLETRLVIGEAGRFGPVIAKARKAVAERDLPAKERLDAELAVVTGSIGRIDELLGGARFEGRAVDARGRVAEGDFALVGPLAVFASKDRTAVGIALPQAGSDLPAVRPIEETMSSSIVALIETGSGLFPLDATAGGAMKALVEKWSLIEIFRKGGPIMYPLLLVSILALTVVLERVIFILAETRKRDPKAMQALLTAVEKGRFDEAVRVGVASRDAVVRGLAQAIGHRGRSLGNALLVATADITARFRRGIGILDTAITISPLLGLLGTVTGMMHSFSLIGGDLGAPGAITGGIAEALIATAFGLVIAIACLIPYNYLNNRVEGIRQDMEAAAAQLELLVHPDRGIVHAVGTAHAAAAGAAS